MISVSIIIPVYNGALFIGQALSSVARQSLPPLQVIVIDDGSTDDTERHVAAFTGSLPLTYRRQEHSGAGPARNFGASLASGNWIAFLDADDLWDRDKLAAQARLIDEDSRLSFLYCDVDLVDENGAPLQRRWASAEFVEKRPNSHHRLSQMIFGGKPFPLPSTVLMKRDLFELAGGFNAAFGGKYHEDFEFFARVAEMAPMRFLPQSLVKHRSHGALSPSQVRMDRDNWLLFLDCLWETWRHAPDRQLQLIPYFAKHYADQAKLLLRAGNYAEARHYCRLAAGYQPFGITNLRHWLLALLPGARNFYRARSAKRRRKRRDGS